MLAIKNTSKIASQLKVTQPETAMFIPSKWRILTCTAPLTIGFALIKYVFHQQGWELWSFNALTSSLFGSITFIIAFQLNGTLNDYRSSCSLPTNFCQSIMGIQDSNLFTASCRSDYDPQPLTAALVNLTAQAKSSLQSESDLQSLLASISSLSEQYTLLEKYAIGSSLGRVQSEQSNLRSTILEIAAVRDSDYIGPAYVLLEIFTLASTIALLLIHNDNQSESIIISSLLFVVFLYLILLIKDLDNPFQYQKFSSLDAPLNVLDETINQLQPKPVDGSAN
jgi:hypothetical protein